MASPVELMGVGVAAQTADLLGGEPSVLTCAGTAQAGAAAILSKNTELSAAGGATGAVLPSNGPIDAPFFVFTSSSTSAVVYPPSGQYLNGATSNSLTVAQNKGALLWQYKKGYWASILTA